MTSLGLITRPGTASIFASDPATQAKIVVFILQDVAIPVPGRVRLDLLKSMSATSPVTVARSPVERVVADNILIGGRVVRISGTLTATPLGILSAQLGAFGSIVRRDLRELAKLRRIQATREPVALVTPSEVFTSMAMSIDEVHDGSNKVELSLSFEKIRIVSPLAVLGELDYENLLAGAGSSQQVGAQSTEVVASPPGLGAGGLG